MYVWALQRVKDADQFEATLRDPLPGDTPDDVDSQTIEDENAMFARFAAEAGRM